MATARFEAADINDELPAPGYYAGTITTARLRRSAGGNRMVHVVFALDGVAAGHDRVAEYFVLEGASGRGLALARRRLVELYRACGLDPRPGDEIAPDDLVGARVEVKLEHETWQGEMRLRVAGHRRPATAVEHADESVPF
jgi:hypothetical protein